MASAAADLTEPHVLAHAKRRLFPSDEGSGSYAVVDTQFSAEEWRPDRRIERSVREVLAPFNHVRIGGGYPDLVGVRKPESEWLAVERFGDEPPLVVVGAKGYAGGGVDTQRGIVQAYDRLHEANAAYLAVPGDAVAEPDRTLARELNVGILGVGTDGAVEPLEIPRVVGNRTTDEATAARFQASAQGVADRSFGLNHPKNYLAYPLALRHPDGTDAVLANRVVRATSDARRGAAFLDLIEERPDRVELAPLGREVVRFASTGTARSTTHSGPSRGGGARGSASATSLRSGAGSSGASCGRTRRRRSSSRSSSRCTTTGSSSRRSSTSSSGSTSTTRRSPSSCSSAGPATRAPGCWTGTGSSGSVN